MGRLLPRRWVRRAVVATAVAGAAFAFRQWKLAQNARRYGLPS